jgi:hypothetical protein
MGLFSRARVKFEQAGFQGVLASAFRHAADRMIRNRENEDLERIADDEFLAWVRLAVPGMLCQGNIEAMQYAILNMPQDKPIMEIGSFCGLSTIVMSHLLNKSSKPSKIFTCDKWEFEGQQLGSLLGDYSSVTHNEYREYVKRTFVASVQTFTGGRLPFTIECISDEFFRRWFENEKTADVFDRPVILGGEISFCYIDGNHTYEFAKRDFENANRALVPGGFILFDDSADGSDWEVNRLTREISSGNDYELVSRNPNYLFRKK